MAVVTKKNVITQLFQRLYYLISILANKHIQRVDQTRQEDKMETLDLSKTIGQKSKVHAAFIDPMGFHLMMSLKPTGNYLKILILNFSNTL